MAEKMNITLGYDASDCANVAVDDLTIDGIPQGSTIHVVSVSEWFPLPFSEGGVDVIPEKAYPEASDAEETARLGAEKIREARPDLEVLPVGTSGSPAHQIVSHAEEVDSDLVIVGSHGRSAIGRFFIGSVSHQVLTGAHCSVRIARSRPEGEAGGTTILAAVDGSEYTPVVVDAILEREWPEESTVLLLTSAEYSYDPDEEKASLDSVRRLHQEIAARFDAAGIPCESLIDTERVHPTKAILKVAEERTVDMIILGARGLTGFERFVLGSVSSAVALHARCSVEVRRIRK